MGASPEGRCRRKPQFAQGMIVRMRELIQSGKFGEAFRIGEWLLDNDPLAETFDALLSPLERNGAHGGVIPSAMAYDLMQELQVCSGAPALWPWRLLLEVELLDKVGRAEEAFAAARRMDALEGRYGWMRHNRGVLFLRVRREYDEAKREFECVLRSAPVFWKAQACLAEAVLCRGDLAGALGIMDGLADRLTGVDRTAALVWRGEINLWVGRYREALADTEKAPRGRSALALCWRGAARLQLGDCAAAVADLDEHLRYCPEDVEALIWRGEAKRRQGFGGEAIKDLDAAIRIASDHPLWALANRALVRSGLSDPTGMRSDYRKLPRVVRSYFEWKLGLRAEDPGPEGLRAVLESIMEAGKGVRRSDSYLFPIWIK